MVPFTGRQDVLNEIYPLVEDQGGQNIICIEASGGIGKTRLLEEIALKYHGIGEQKKLLSIEIIDFDDQSFLSPKQTGRKIARILGEEEFSTYFKAQQQYRQMTIAGVGLDELEQVRQNVRITFEECFNRITENTRILLSFDTTDHLEEGKGMWREFATIAHLRNVCVLVSGRNARKIGSWLKAHGTTAQVHRIQLLPLNEKESRFYLEAKQRSRHVPMSTEITDKIIILSAGKPILLDLAVEWLCRNIPLEWLYNVPVSELSTKKRQKEFEKLLVHKITELRKPIDRLVLIMAHVYPLDEEMIDYFIKTDAQRLMNEAKTYVFIKQLPGGFISLHDEVRRMVNEYVLPNDRKDILRELKGYSKDAAAYFAIQGKKLKKQLEEIENIGNGQTKNAQYIKRGELLRKRIFSMEKEVYHTFFWNMKQGVQTYSEVIWRLRRDCRIQAAIRVQESIRLYLDGFDEEQRHQYELLRVRLLNDSGKAEEAEGILLEFLEQKKSVTDAEKADIYNALAVSELRLGKLNQALEHQLACLEFMIQAKKIEFIPDIANHTGYIYERIGNVKAAVEYYHKAFETTLKAEQPGRNLMAKTLDNLSYAYCQLGSFAEAQSYVDQALKIWDIIKEENQIARGEITQGVIYRDLGRYDDAVIYLRRAIERLEEPDDHQKLIKAFFHLGWTQWFKAAEMETKDEQYTETLRSARRDFEHSLQLAEKYRLTADLPGILHQMSNVYHLLGEKEKALEINNRAYDLSRKVHDIRYAVDSLVGKAEFDYDNGQYDQIPDYARELEEGYEDKGYEFPRFYGRMRRILADIAFEREEYSLAQKDYIRAIAQIRQHSGYGMYSIDKELARLEKKLQVLPAADIALEMCIHMRSEWAKMEPAEKYLRMLSWCDQQIVNLQLKALI